MMCVANFARLVLMVHLFVCSTATTFTPWHIEDKGLGAMNHLVWGGPKLWLLAPTLSVAEKLGKLLEEKHEEKWQDLLYGKKLNPYQITLKEALDCGFVPFVQQPSMVVYTHGVAGVHVTMSSGVSLAIASNCFFGDDLAAHLDYISDHGCRALNAGNHKKVGDTLIKCLKLSHA